jgi:hypothetical protein
LIKGNSSWELTFLFKNKVHEVSLIDIQGLKNGSRVVLFTKAPSELAKSFQ